jgi:hypothetical protein
MYRNKKQIGNGNFPSRLPNAESIDKEKSPRAYKADAFTFKYLPPVADAGVATPRNQLPLAVRLDKHNKPVGGRRTRRSKRTNKRKNKKGYKSRKGKK